MISITTPVCSPERPVVKRRHASGFSLIELMIAITIGLIIVTAVIQIYLTSRTTYTHEEGLARVQEGGRFGMEFLATDIRMAGYTGCDSSLATTDINNIAVPATDAYKLLAGGMRGYRYIGPGTVLSAWEPDLPADYFAAGDVRAGTDVIVIQRASALDTNLTGNLGTTNANIQILATAAVSSEISADDILIISDCTNADIFRATSASSGAGTMTIAHASSNNSSNDLSKKYDTRAQIMKLVSRAYFIGTGTGGEPSLMRKELTNAAASPPIVAQELVEGVEDMRILYGLDTDTTKDYVPNQYLHADSASITDWSKVVSIRLALLIRTPTNIQGTDTQTYNLTDATVGPFNDNRRRHVFSSTIKVRNSGT